MIKNINQHLDSDGDLKNKRDLLDSISGVGERATAILLSFYTNLNRFSNERQAVAFGALKSGKSFDPVLHGG